MQDRLGMFDRHWPMVAFCDKRSREELVEPIAKTNWTNPKTKGVIIAKYIGDRVCHAQIAMFSFFFGSAADGRNPPSIGDGHKTVEVIIDDEHLQVDVDVLAEVSGLFLQIQSTDAKDCPLREFPGGLERFRSIVGFLIDNDALTVVEDTVLDLLEATWLLECPSLLDGVMQSSFVTSLSSRRRVEILEHLLPYTAASSPADSEHAIESLDTSTRDTLGNWDEHGVASPNDSEAMPPSLACKQFLRLFHFETLMWQTTEKAALTLASQLDSGDFILGPRLATGSLRVCSELLRLRRLREEESGFVSTAIQPVSALWKNLGSMLKST